MDEVEAALLVEREDDLGVARRDEPAPPLLELGAAGAVVVELAVEGDPDAPLALHGLGAPGREVEDREARVREARARPLDDPPRVGSSVVERFRHGPEDVPGDHVARVGADDAGDPAHASGLS